MTMCAYNHCRPYKSGLVDICDIDIDNLSQITQRNSCKYVNRVVHVGSWPEMVNMVL